MKTKFDNIKLLSDKKIFAGIKHCFKNSNNLFSSALTLKRNKKFNVATSVLTLSVEELMTSVALFELLIAETDEKDAFKDIFESKDLHGSRHDFALFMNEFFKTINLKKLMKSDIVINNPKDLSNFLSGKINLKKVLKNIEKEKKTFNNWFDQANKRKNEGLYVIYNDRWFSPDRINEKEFVKALKETKLIRGDISTILKLIISLDENEFSIFIDFMKQTKKHLEPEIGIEPISQGATSRSSN